ncbi:MAG: conjugal transfer protein [Solirubrobacterales bacterium]|nr:conjugal transfer protein [Solirubrobacterales bacterium]
MTDQAGANHRPPARLDHAARIAGRLLLWAFVVVVLVRGLSAIIAPDQGQAPDVETASASGGDWEVGAFAVRFARGYFAAPGEPGGDAARLYADGVADRLDPTGRSEGVAVEWAHVARHEPTGQNRVLVTVAAGIAGGRVLYLTVPVARDRQGGLAVFDLPALTAPPGLAADAAETATPLTGPDGQAVADLAGRFLRAYVSGGGRAKLAYFLAPSAQITQMPDGLEVAEVGEVDEIDTDGPGRTIAAAVSVRDTATGAVFPARYRLGLVREDRWLVASVAGGPRR